MAEEEITQVCEHCGGWGVFIPADRQQYYQLDDVPVMSDVWMQPCEIVCAHCGGTGLVVMGEERHG